MDKLNLKQELFCMYYGTNEAGTFGNGTKSYMLVYPESSEESARSDSSRLLTNANILNRIKELWKKSGLTDEEVDAHLADIIRQNKDLSTKLGGIREYNKIRGRITEKHEVMDLTDHLRSLKNKE